MSFAVFLQTFVPAVLVPVASFIGNGAYRYAKGYQQTAAADFLIAVVVFDAAVISATDAFKPFVRDPELRTVIVNWHLAMVVLSALFWMGILAWLEPSLEGYYEESKIPIDVSFPVLHFLAAWVLVLMDVALHIGFFVMNGSF
jgi:hypothetical protein